MGGNRELAERFIATLEARDWDAWAGLLHPGVVYEIPQSRERIRGRDRYLRFNQEYPGDWHLRLKVAIADELHRVVWFEWLLDGHPGDAVAFFEFADGVITRVTDFWPEPYEPPPGREHLVERWLPAAPGRSGWEPSRAARRAGPCWVFWHCPQEQRAPFGKLSGTLERTGGPPTIPKCGLDRGSMRRASAASDRCLRHR